MFTDREQAGRALAKKLESLRGENAVVLALPRGGVVLGAEVARALQLPLDIMSVRKIGHPSSPEFAIGAVEENGEVLMGDADEIDTEWLQEESERQKAEARRRSHLYRSRPAIPLGKKIVVLIDDGIATGLTMRLAVRAVKAQKPRTIIIAVPVAPEEAIAVLHEEGVDEVIVLGPPNDFLGAVGSHYLHFDQVGDDEVIKLMKNL